MRYLIDIQAAIDAIHKEFDDCIVWDESGMTTANEVERILDGIPPAKRKTGKWIQNDNGTYSCSLCHSWIPEEQYYYANYCLYCGADMRGDKV